MELLVILFLCTLATSKVTLQGFFAKKNVTSFSDGIFFNGLMFFFSALIFLKNAMDFQSGLAVGVVLGVFQFINTRAIASINGTLLFPAYNGGALILSSISSILFIKDRLTNNQKNQHFYRHYFNRADERIKEM